MLVKITHKSRTGKYIISQYGNIWRLTPGPDKNVVLTSECGQHVRRCNLVSDPDFTILEEIKNDKI